VKISKSRLKQVRDKSGVHSRTLKAGVTVVKSGPFLVADSGLHAFIFFMSVIYRIFSLFLSEPVAVSFFKMVS
jgi:hypothetical protein